MLSQMGDILKGNLYGSGTIPLIQQGVDAARSAASTSLNNAQGYMAQIGASRSPFAASIMSMLSQQGNEAVAAVPTDIAQQFLGMTPGAISSGTNATMSGLANAIRGNMTTNGTNLGFDLSQGTGATAGSGLLAALGSFMGM